MSQKNLLIRGTLILTISGLLTRILGFFYRIFLADALGAEALGIYQLVFPVYGLCFTLFAAGNQTALSKMVASYEVKKHRQLLFRTLFIALTTALSLCLLLFFLAPFVAERFLQEGRAAGSLQVLAFSFPFCAVTACINGFYYGRKQAGVPAATQFIEQVVRIAVVYMFTKMLSGEFHLGHSISGSRFTCEMAVLGLLFGEIASMLFNSLSFLLTERRQAHLFSDQHSSDSPSHPTPSSFAKRSVYPELFKISLPITGNRFTISLLHSAEAILLPTFLKLSGCSPVEALSLYGILNGMAMPFILFPSTITNSLSVMLLPTVADAAARNHHTALTRTVSAGIRYSILISILCTGIFLLYGYDMGRLFFHSTTAGSYIRTLSWLCPFLYLNTTLGSILNGLDLAPTVFLQNVLASAIRILFLLFFVPRFGMSGYLWGMLAGSLCLTLMHLYTLRKSVPNLQAPVGIVIAAVLTVLTGLELSRKLPLSFLPGGAVGLPSLAFRCLFVCLLFLLLFFHTEKQFSPQSMKKNSTKRNSRTGT